MVREIRELFSYHSRGTGRFAEHDYHNVFEKAQSDLGSVGFEEFAGRDLLDLGCGQRAPFALLSAAAGAKATALDINYIKPDVIPVAFYRIVRHNGIKRSIKTVIRRLFFDKIYYDNLEVVSDKNIRQYKSEIRYVIDEPKSSNYPLPSDSFDLIVSNAVVEHIVDVPTFAIEIRRFLKPGGYFYSIIHNFYSLSGGHNLEWAFPDEHPSIKVPPWDHLRENLYPAWTYLNCYKPQEYREAFSKHLEIVYSEGRDINHDPGGLEGEIFLTEEIAEELKVFPKELLLTRSWLIICKKG